MQNVSMQRGEKVELNERQHKTLIKRKLISRLNWEVRGEEKLMLLDEISLEGVGWETFSRWFSTAGD